MALYLTPELRIIFGNDDFPEMVLPIPKNSDPEFYSLGTEQLVTLPNGEVLDVYAEVSLASAVAAWAPSTGLLKLGRKT